MDKIVNFIQEKRVGLWCKRAAWIIVILNVISLIVGVFGNFPPGGFPPPTNDQLTIILLNTARMALSIAASTIFSFFVLYAVGTLLEELVGKPEEDELEGEEEDEEEEGVNEALLPGQRLH